MAAAAAAAAAALENVIAMRVAVTDVLDNCLWPGALLKADGVAHLLSKHHIHLLSNTPCDRHGGHPPGLSAGHLLLGSGVASLRDELRNLGGLAAACLSHQDGGLIFVQNFREVCLGLPYWETCSGAQV